MKTLDDNAGIKECLEAAFDEIFTKWAKNEKLPSADELIASVRDYNSFGLQYAPRIVNIIMNTKSDDLELMGYKLREGRLVPPTPKEQEASYK